MSNLSPSPETPSDWQRREQERARLASEAIAANKAALFEALAAAGITNVEVRFDGYGDSGQIEEVTATSNGGDAAIPGASVEFAEPRDDQSNLEPRTIALGEAIETLAYNCLALVHDGWEINDGSYGELVFDVAGRTITLHFNGRYTESDYSQHSF